MASVSLAFAVMELRDLQREYLDDVRRTLVDIRVHGRDLAAPSTFKDAFPALLFLTHQLKGSGGSLGFPRISEVAGEMTRTLDRFLDEKQIARPTPAELARTLLTLSSELDAAVASASATLA